jgi:cbb3-type cytochrome oxidase subunit 3
MTGKLIGIFLLACGVAGACMLWALSRTTKRTHDEAAVRRFKLDHEYENKGFTEKGQSEGIADIPKECSTVTAETIEQDPYFSSPNNTSHDNTPGDNF